MRCGIYACSLQLHMSIGAVVVIAIDDALMSGDNGSRPLELAIFLHSLHHLCLASEDPYVCCCRSRSLKVLVLEEEETLLKTLLKASFLLQSCVWVAFCQSYNNLRCDQTEDCLT